MQRYAFYYPDVAPFSILSGAAFAPISQYCAGAEGRLVICGANKRIKGIYYVSQLDKVFKTFDTVAEGMAALAAD